MLTRILLENCQIILKFEPKNVGKFRLKKLEGDKLTSTYSSSVKKEDISDSQWYLEWQISYYKDEQKINEIGVPELYIDLPIELQSGRRVYPFELPVLFFYALNHGLLPKQSLPELIEWASDIRSDELLENRLRPNITRQSNEENVKGLSFLFAKVELPLMVYENADRTWVEIIWQKQQYAYSFQPMVYLCIPHYAFSDGYRWIVNSNNVKTLEDLIKIFALTSEVHRSDIIKILQALQVA